MKFGYTMLYVQNVSTSVDFYEEAFGLKRRHIHEAGLYAEMETGGTTIAFVAYELARANLPGGFRKNRARETPGGFAVTLVTQNVEGAYHRAVESGASSIAPPIEKAWGQVCAYVRDLDGITVQICTPMP